LPASPTIVDNVSQLFRPAVELDMAQLEVQKAPFLPPLPMQRMLTYEDVAFPKDSHDVTRRDSWCEMFAVRTPQRPVKVMTASSPGGEKTLVLPAIWKAASTSLTSMLEVAQHKGLAQNVLGPHVSKCPGCCTAPNVLDQCEKHTSFDDNAAKADVKAAMVRSPLDRFLASVYEHGEWKACGGQVCSQMVADAKRMALRLARDFPHRYRSCEHPSQTYFLSATDVDGKPYAWDYVLRLEEFDAGREKLQDMSGIKLSAMTENTSGDRHLKKMYFDAVFNDLETLCSVCKVYAQDFECLGYAKPDRCTQEQCSKVGIALP